MSKTLKSIILATLALIATTSSISLVVATTGNKGLAIATEADRVDQGFRDHRADMKMTLQNSHGETSRRDLRTYTLEGTASGDKTLIVFEAPRDIKGTALLTHSQLRGNDDQWLYMPAIRRVKRISAGNRSGPFMGSEFAYEDLSSPELQKYTYKYEREDDCGKGGGRCWVIERVPQDPKSGYKRQLVWIDQQAHRYRKVDFYDRKNTLLKTVTLAGYRQYLGRYWRPSTAHMHNHQTGKSTTLEWSKYEFRTGLTANDFEKGSLKRLAR